MKGIELIILENLCPDFDAKYIARDEDDSLWVFNVRPVKGANTWSSDYFHPPESLNMFQHLFQFIQWEDKEPWKIEKELIPD